MERSNKSILILLLLFSAGLAASEPDDGWQWVLERDGVNVYRRAVEGSAIDESLAITRINASLSAATALILDVENNHRWIDSVDQSRVVERVRATESINYTVSHAPWPVSDRDAVVRTTVSQEPQGGAVFITTTAQPERLPPSEGMIRVRAINSSWRLLPLAEGGVEVHYQVHSEPGGSLPDWLVNAVVVDQPLKTLYNMARESTLRPYAGARLPFIRDPAATGR